MEIYKGLSIFKLRRKMSHTMKLDTIIQFFVC